MRILVLGLILTACGGCVRPLLLAREIRRDTRAAIQQRKEAPLGTEQLSIRSTGRTRTYCLAVPTKLSGQVPLIIAFHGLGGSGKQILGDDGLVNLGLKQGLIVVGPDALPMQPDREAAFGTNSRMWRTGRLADRSGIDDVAFVKSLIKDLEAKYPIDKKRIYVVGHSSGGGMTFNFAMRDSEEVAAIGTVASQVLAKVEKPSHPIPTICFMGTDDPLIPPKGGQSKLPGAGRLPVPPASEYLSRWSQANGWPASPKTVSDDNVALVQEYSQDFRTILVKGQGHAWPGGDALRLPESYVGPQLHTINATAQIWTFVSKYRLL